MNILLILNKSGYGTGEYFEKYFRRNHTVTTVGDLFNDKVTIDIHSQEPYKVAASIVKERNIDVLIEVESGGIPWEHVPVEINIPKIYYAIDSHISLEGHKIHAKAFDHVFLAQKKYISPVQSSCPNGKVKWLPLGCDPEIHTSSDFYNRNSAIAFVGNHSHSGHARRQLYMFYLYGKVKTAFTKGIYGREMGDYYAGYSFAFNCSLNDDLNMRVFETMGCGCLLFTDRLSSESGLDDFFIDKEHLILYNNESELLELVQYYQNHIDDGIEIAKNGQKEVHLNHSYEKRAQEILSCLN